MIMIHGSRGKKQKQKKNKNTLSSYMEPGGKVPSVVLLAKISLRWWLWSWADVQCTLLIRKTIFPFLINSNFKSNYLIVNHPLVFSSKLQRHLLGDSDDHIQHKVLTIIFKIGHFIHDLQFCFAARE